MTEPEYRSGEPHRSWSRSTARAATILSYFSLEEPRLKIATLAERLGLHPSTVYRYVEALEGAHLLDRDEQTGTYKLGIRLVELSTVVLRDLDVRRQALDEMHTLRDKLGMLVNLAVLRDADVVHVAHAFPLGWPRESMDLVPSAVAQTTALGKVLLASIPWAEAVSRVTDAGWRPYTSNSIHDETALKADLDEVQNRGFAIDREERHLGLMCIAVPVRATNREVPRRPERVRTPGERFGPGSRTGI